MPGKKHTILVVSHNPHLADVRKQVLEEAGFTVVAANDVLGLREACSNENGISLIMIGHSLPPAEKRRVRHEARQCCKVPILELYSGDAPELVGELSHHSETPKDFLHAVLDIVR